MTVLFVTEQGRQPCVQLPIWRTRFLYLYPRVTGWPSLYPHEPSSLLVAFYDSQGYGGVIRATVELLYPASTRRK
jgi:hypothetical protein